MRVLIACEESQEVCKAFRRLGFEAYSCDLQPCSGGHPEWHIQGDCVPLLNEAWDLIISHPPCTYMSKAGARWLYLRAGVRDEARYKKAMEAKEFFLKCYNANCRHIVVENPTPLKCIELPEPSQVIQPFEFDPEGLHPYTKRTLLWLKNLPPLKKTTPDAVPITTWLPSNTGGYSRGKGGGRGIAHDAKTASKTFPGIAQAMAEQWGSYLLNEQRRYIK